MTQDNSEYPAELFEGLAKIYESLPEGFTVYLCGAYRPMSIDEFSGSLQIAIQHIFHEVAFRWYEVEISDGPVSDKDWEKQIVEFKRPFDLLPSSCKDISKRLMHYCKLAGDDYHGIVAFGDIFKQLPKKAVKEIDQMINTFRTLVVHQPIMEEIDRVFAVLDKIRKRDDLG